MMDLKIIMVHSGSLDINTGGGIHTFELFKNLCSRNKVICFASKSSKTIVEHPNLRYIPCFDVPGIKSISYDAFLLFYLAYYCLTFKPDIIYTRKPGLGLAPALLAKIFRVPYVVELNGLKRDDMLALNPDSSTFIVRIAEFVEKINYVLAAAIVVVTPEIKNGLRVGYGIPETKINVIENGVNSDLFRPIDKKEAIAWLGLDQTYNYICFVGGLAPWHGVEFLVEAAPLVLKEVPNTIFLIVGDGPMKSKLMEQVNDLELSDHFIFTGRVPHADIPYYICSSELCTAPFIPGRNDKTGLSPLKIYEYLACGKPVVASNLPGMEIVTESRGGVIVEPRNAEDLGQAIVRMLTDGCDEVAESHDLSKYISEHHSWAKVAKKTETVLTMVV
jgi:glycosyltransferase involved in cell wall biosynthesis